MINQCVHIEAYVSSGYCGLWTKFVLKYQSKVFASPTYHLAKQASTDLNIVY